MSVTIADTMPGSSRSHVTFCRSAVSGSRASTAFSASSTATTLSAVADLRIRQTPLAKLHPNPRNPRTISERDFERLKESLAADPDMLKARPIVALPDGTVIAGNQRLRAAEALGWKAVPAVTVDLDPARALTWATRDNISAGTWDEALLGDLLSDLEQAFADLLPLAGFDDGEGERLLASFRDGEPPEPTPKSRPTFGKVVICPSCGHEFTVES